MRLLYIVINMIYIIKNYYIISTGKRKKYIWKAVSNNQVTKRLFFMEMVRRPFVNNPIIETMVKRVTHFVLFQLFIISWGKKQSKIVEQS